MNTPAERVAAYIKLRDYKKAAEDELKKSLSKVNLAMEKLEGQLLQDLDAAGVNSMAGDAGTVYKNTHLSATVENRDIFMNAVRSNDLWEALDVKANKTFVKEYMEEHGAAIPGLKITQVATVGVRRS